jgi:hypothetical protein
MNDTDIVTQIQNPLAPVVIGLIRALSMERDAHTSTRAVLHEAIALVREQDQKLDRERASRFDLLSQYRALISGRTKAEERQALDEAAETVDASHGRSKAA